MKGCDPLVVEFLLQQYPMALSARDTGYNLPIHWLTGCHFSVPQVTRLFVQGAPESVEKRITYPGGQRRTLLEAALTGRRFLSDDAALARNEESIRIIVDAYPRVLAELVEYTGSEEQAKYEDMNLRNELYVDTMSSLHLHSLLQSKPTDSLVKLFLSNFPEAVRVRDGESWTILMHGQIIERLSLSTKRMLILHSAERNTMSLQLRFITPELAKTIVEEANDHPEISKLVLYVNDKMDLESHQALLVSKPQPDTTSQYPRDTRFPFFSRATHRCNTSTSTYYHSSAFEGLCQNSQIQQFGGTCQT